MHEYNFPYPTTFHLNPRPSPFILGINFRSRVVCFGLESFSSQRNSIYLKYAEKNYTDNINDKKPFKVFP